MKYTIGIDVGGTKISAALVSRDKVIKKLSMPTKANKGRKEVIKRITQSIELIKEGLDKKDIKGIGIAMAGWINKKGVVINSPNIRNFRNVPLRSIIKNRFKLPTAVENDTNAFALAESVFGAGRGKKNIVCLTIGTGLGGGIIINKKVYSGNGEAGELGHMTIVAGGQRCSCGNRGCLEQYVASKAIARYSKKFLGKVLQPLEVELKARKGHKPSIKVYETAGSYLGVGLVNINNIFDPDLIVIGGSIANSDYLILNPARKALKEGAIDKPVKVAHAKLGKDAGAIGAALLI